MVVVFLHRRKIEKHHLFRGYSSAVFSRYFSYQFIVWGSSQLHSSRNSLQANHLWLCTKRLWLRVVTWVLWNFWKCWKCCELFSTSGLSRHLEKVDTARMHVVRSFFKKTSLLGRSHGDHRLYASTSFPIDINQHQHFQPSFQLPGSGDHICPLCWSLLIISDWKQPTAVLIDDFPGHNNWKCWFLSSLYILFSPHRLPASPKKWL